MFGKLGLLIVAASAAACEPELKVGTWPCTSSSGPAGTMPDGSVVSIKDPVPFPWQNGFEDGFCGYANAKGYCYKDPNASYGLVDAPVHSGQHAARFTVMGDDSRARQTRCVREGAMPPDAVYGAWFFLAAAVTGGNWNLMYFNAGNAEGLHGLPYDGAEWDVSIGDDGDGGPLTLHILNHMDRLPDPADGGTPPPAPAVPVGEWFHVEFRIVRAQDATGRVTLSQDGEPVLDYKNIQTELTGATWGQWYVGNLVGSNVTPPESTLYVDDVSIAPPP